MPGPAHDDLTALRARVQVLEGRLARFGLLSRASELLDVPLEERTHLERICEMCVPELGDLAMVDLLDDAGRFGAVLAHGDPELVAVLQEMRAAHPLDPDGEHPIALAARSGVPALLDAVPHDLLEELAEDEAHLAQLLALDYRSSLLIPLVARSRVLGVLTCVRRGAGAAPYDDGDLETARELVRRVAPAVERARAIAELRRTEAQLEAIVEHLDEAVGAFAPDGTLVWANRAGTALLGQGAQHVPDHDSWETFDGLGGPLRPEDHPLARALAGERPPPLTLRARHRASGEERWLVARATPVLDEGGALQMVVAVAEDVTRVKREEERQRVLAVASKMLATSLDVATTVEKCAWAAVPELCDWARVDLPDDRGELRGAAAAHVDRAQVDALLAAPAHADAQQALRTGRPVAREAPAADEHGTTSVLTVPLTGGAREIGTLRLGTTTASARRLTSDDVQTAMDLAERMAIAIEHARVHAARTHIATTLQRSLLPPRLPVIPGLQVAARFRAAGGQTTEVGGDFYDLFPVDGGWLLVVGDVTGKGPGAAAITSLARYTARTAALYERRPERVLARLDEVLRAETGRRRLCTAVCARIDVGATDGAPVRVALACAGHPQPFLLDAAGGVREAGGAGPLLGAFADAEWEAEDLELADGDGLVLFTDGVTDARSAEGRFGVERLAEVLHALPPDAEPDVVAAAIDAAVRAFEEGPQRDDIALVVLRAGGAGTALVAATADDEDLLGPLLD